MSNKAHHFKESSDNPAVLGAVGLFRLTPVTILPARK